MSAETCTRCGHDTVEHGAGCTSGWFQPGPECHCPNDSAGEVAQSCARVGCVGAQVTHVDRFGQFFCAGHPETSARPIDEIETWVAA